MSLISFISRRFSLGGESRKIVGNTVWLVSDRILRMGAGLFVAIWVARYLGPDQFGLYSYAIAFVAMFGALASLGLEEIVVKEIVQHPESKDELLGTAFQLKLIGAVVALGMAAGSTALLRPGDRLTWLLVCISAAGFIFQAFDTIGFWFQANLASKFTVWAKNTSFMLVAAAKVVLVLTGAPLLAFAWAGLAELGLGACGLVIAYRANGHRLKDWRGTRTWTPRLLRASWPLMLSGIVVTVYIRIDQVMLGQMMGNQAVGIYSAAVRVSEVWYFVPMAITASVFPSLISAKHKSESSYYDGMGKLFLLMIWLSLAVAIPVSLFSKPIISLLYGDQYLNASSVLSISCWAGIFIFSGLVSNQYYLLENLNHLTLCRHILGAGVNIGLNLLLIPAYGAKGAALATLITQFVASYLFDLMNRSTFVLFRIKTRNILFLLPLTLKVISGRRYPYWNSAVIRKP